MKFLLEYDIHHKPDSLLIHLNRALPKSLVWTGFPPLGEEPEKDRDLDVVRALLAIDGIIGVIFQDKYEVEMIKGGAFDWEQERDSIEENVLKALLAHLHEDVGEAMIEHAPPRYWQSCLQGERRCKQRKQKDWKPRRFTIDYPGIDEEKKKGGGKKTQDPSE